MRRAKATRWSAAAASARTTAKNDRASGARHTLLAGHVLAGHGNVAGEGAREAAAARTRLLRGRGRAARRAQPRHVHDVISVGQLVGGAAATTAALPRW